MAKQTTTERLKAIQRRLGVEDDGILGPVTLSRIDSILDEVLGPAETEPEHSLVVSRSLTYIEGCPIWQFVTYGYYEYNRF
jgi:hypothetical protein